MRSWCAAHRRRRASQHAFETRTFVRFAFPRASSSIDSRATTSDRRSNPRVKMWGVFPPTREKPCPCHTRQHRLSKRHFRENNNAQHNAFRLTGRIWPPTALLWARRCLGEETQRVFRRRDGDGERLGRAAPALPLDRPRDVLRAPSNRTRSNRAFDANWVFANWIRGRRTQRARFIA